MIRGYCHAFYLEVPWIMPLIFPQFLSCLPWNSHQEEWSWGNICIFLISLFHRSKEIKIYSSLILAYIANVSLIWYIHLFCLNQVKHKKHQIIFIAINKHNHRYELQYSWYFETYVLSLYWIQPDLYDLILINVVFLFHQLYVRVEFQRLTKSPWLIAFLLTACFRVNVSC